ncbi:MAG TPA: flagellin, partial [Giesbergeria sp.]|nr:flagellin [Giesbergeria sp.]
IGDARASALGGNVLTADGTVTGNAINTSATDNGVGAVVAGDAFTITTTDAAGSALTTAPITYSANAGANVIAGAINTAGAGVGVTAVATNSATLSGLSGAGTVTFTLETQVSATTPPNGTFTTKSAAISAVVNDQNDLSSLVSAINGQQSTTGITAEFTTAGNKSSITLKTLDGRNIGIDSFSSTGAGAQTVSFAGVTLTEGAPTDSGLKTGTISLTSARGAISTANAAADVFAAAGVNNSSFESVAAIDISTAAGAQTALGTIDAALAQVSGSRAALGAYQNRFESVIGNLQTSSENLSASRSRIQDADFAAETANLSRAQILQQAGTAMVAQANQLPQQVLKLLQ